MERIRIGHDGASAGSGWFLDEVRLDIPSKGLHYVFACHRWLDTREADGKIEIEMEPTHTDQGVISKTSLNLSSSSFSCFQHLVKKARSYIVQYPVVRTIQSALHFTSLADSDTMFTRTPCSLGHHVHSDTISASLGSIQPYAFNTTAEDSNPGSRSRESGAPHTMAGFQ